MPSKSKAQHNLMAMVANDPAAAKRVGIPQSVGSEYMKADKGKKFGTGGQETRADLQGVNKPKTHRSEKAALFRTGGDVKESKATVKKEVSFLKKAGAPKSLVKHEESEMKKMASGGITTAKMGKVTAGGKKAFGEHSVQKKGHTKGAQVKMAGSKPMGMKKGGKC